VGTGLILAALIAVLALLVARAPTDNTPASSPVTVPPAPALGTAGLSPAVQPPTVPAATPATTGAATP
jgi:hypothetical protein